MACLAKQPKLTTACCSDACPPLLAIARARGIAYAVRLSPVAPSALVHKHLREQPNPLKLASACR
eukprot:1011698-Alexandrium_andersonii.AAC.1